MHLVFSKKSKGKLTGEDAAAGAGPDEPSAPVLMALPTAASPADCPDELNELEEPTSMRSSILGCAPPAQAQAALCPTGATLTRILALGAGCQRERGEVLPIGEAVTAEHDRFGHRCLRANQVIAQSPPLSDESMITPAQVRPAPCFVGTERSENNAC